MAVKLAASMGAKVTVFSTSPGQQEDARRLGATDVVATRAPGALERFTGKLDAIIDTVSAPHDYDAYLRPLRPRGTMAIVGAPAEAAKIQPFSLILGGERFIDSVIGGIAETQEMLDHCTRHGIVSDIELIPIQKINEAYDRVLKSDVRHRFVADGTSLRT